MPKKVKEKSASILTTLWLKWPCYDFENPWNDINSSRTWYQKSYISFWYLDLEFVTIIGLIDFS